MTPSERAEAIVGCFVAAGYREDSCRGERADRVLRGWSGASVSRAAIEAGIRELRRQEAGKRRTPGFPTARPIEALEMRVALLAKELIGASGVAGETP